jgi:hypothetical protein
MASFRMSHRDAKIRNPQFDHHGIWDPKWVRFWGIWVFYPFEPFKGPNDRRRRSTPNPEGSKMGHFGHPRVSDPDRVCETPDFGGLRGVSSRGSQSAARQGNPSGCTCVHDVHAPRKCTNGSNTQNAQTTDHNFRCGGLDSRSNYTFLG